MAIIQDKSKNFHLAARGFSPIECAGQIVHGSISQRDSQSTSQVIALGSAISKLAIAVDIGLDKRNARDASIRQVVNTVGLVGVRALDADIATVKSDADFRGRSQFNINQTITQLQFGIVIFCCSQV